MLSYLENSSKTRFSTKTGSRSRSDLEKEERSCYYPLPLYYPIQSLLPSLHNKPLQCNFLNREIIKFEFLPEWHSTSSMICYSFSSVAKSSLTVWDPTDCSTPGFPDHHQLPKLAQTQVHWVYDAVQPSHPPSSPSSPAFNLFQHLDLFQWGSSLHPVAKVLESQLQHQSFQWMLSVDFL